MPAIVRLGYQSQARPGGWLRVGRTGTIDGIAHHQAIDKAHEISFAAGDRLPSDLEQAIAGFIQHFNGARYHKSLDSVTPADVYVGRAERILKERDQIKTCTLAG